MRPFTIPILVLVALLSVTIPTSAFGPVSGWTVSRYVPRATTPTVLRMSDSGGGGGGGAGSVEKSKKRGLSTIVIERTEAKMDEDKNPEEMWRLVLHNDEVNTFQHVQRALCEVVSTLDRKRSFDICMETHGIGKATITKSWRQKAEQYCLNLQRQGLTVSIAPDKAFEGGGADGKGPDMS